uniref:Uncharacterized protein n=1 Tax=Acrobeloides nanus TaxID=290746 RepID=A0A914BUN2_9BILA
MTAFAMDTDILPRKKYLGKGKGLNELNGVNRSRSQVRSARRPSKPRASCDGLATNTNNHPSELTLVVMGAEKVGKSALVSQFLWDDFVTEYRPTVEEFNWIEYEMDDGHELLLQVPIMMVANKMDLSMDDWHPDELRDYAMINKISYASISAKHLRKVNQVFGDLLEQLKTSRISGEHQLTKRRQSMPSRRAYSGAYIDYDAIEQIAKKHNRQNCCIM